MIMRCKNCGWENADNFTKCEKCNVSYNEVISAENNSPVSKKKSSDEIEPKKTTKCCTECGYPIGMIEKKCPQCGHVFVCDKQDLPDEEEELLPCESPLPPIKTPDILAAVEKKCVYCNSSVAESARFCINCGVSLSNKNQRETMIPWAIAEAVQTPKCTLTFLSRDGNPTNDSSLRFSGNIIQLNRGNTEPGNQTITSKIQAELSFENDKWYLQDKSALRSTYIYADEKIELRQGDVIVLGNRLFEFNYDSDNLSN